MNLRDAIEDGMKDALRKRDEIRLSVLRMLSAALHNREIEKRGKGQESVLTEEETVAVLRSEARKRRDAIEGFRKGGRRDLEDQERRELEILEGYLPPELSDEDLREAIQKTIQGFDPLGPKDFGRVMGEVMRRVEGRASGERVGRMVKEQLLRDE